MPVAVLITTWSLGVAPVNLKTLGNVSFIVIGVVIASMGEIQFVMVGFLFQCAGIVFEAVRLVMVQRLLSGADFKMDPLVSLYYYAPACAVINGVILLFTELPKMTMADIDRVGLITLLANASVAFLLNVSVVFLVRCLLPTKLTSTYTCPDWQDLLARPHPLWCTQGHSPRFCVHVPLQGPRHPSPGFRLRHCARRSCLLQARRREAEGVPWSGQHEVAGVWPHPARSPQVDGPCRCDHWHVPCSWLSRTPLRSRIDQPGLQRYRKAHRRQGCMKKSSHVQSVDTILKLRVCPLAARLATLDFPSLLSFYL